jgi:hypothetical protein
MSSSARTWIQRWLACCCTVLACLAAGIPGAAAGDGAKAGASAVRNCHVYAFYPSVLISSARNMSCGEAKRQMRRYRAPIYRRFETPGGFSCYRVSGSRYGGQWRCVKGSKAWRFEFSD